MFYFFGKYYQQGEQWQALVSDLWTESLSRQTLNYPKVSFLLAKFLPEVGFVLIQHISYSTISPLVTSGK